MSEFSQSNKLTQHFLQFIRNRCVVNSKMPLPFAVKVSVLSDTFDGDHENEVDDEEPLLLALSKFVYSFLQSEYWQITVSNLGKLERKPPFFSPHWTDI